MGKFRKKPVVIEAVQYGPYTAPTIELMMHLADCPEYEFRDGALFIETLEGTHRADVGDWIIKGVAGEFYPCKPDIFAQTYETESDRFANDANAKALYDCWDDQPGWVPWIERGNSDMQEKARREAMPLHGGPTFNVDAHDPAIDDYFSDRGGK